MLACRLSSILLAITLAEAIDTMRKHRVAPLTGDHTPPSPHPPHHPISDMGVIGCA
jgi:hypothetical protein